MAADTSVLSYVSYTADLTVTRARNSCGSVTVNGTGGYALAITERTSTNAFTKDGIVGTVTFKVLDTADDDDLPSISLAVHLKL
jgi:hypothetical protein